VDQALTVPVVPKQVTVYLKRIPFKLSQLVELYDIRYLASSARVLGGIPRKDKYRSGTRIIYRTACTQSKLFKPREVCSLQDSFIDSSTGMIFDGI